MGDEKDRPLEGYELLLCVTGGIAAYKSADLTSKLIQQGAGVTVAMTEAAMRFVAPLTFQTLSGREVYTSLWSSTEDYRSGHISLTELADLMVVAPATANIIAKITNGIADDLVSTLALSANKSCPILLAPAMNERMWGAPAVQENIARLKQWGIEIVGPEEGYLACGTVGMGRMCSPSDILSAIKAIVTKQPPKRSD